MSFYHRAIKSSTFFNDFTSINAECKQVEAYQCHFRRDPIDCMISNDFKYFSGCWWTKRSCRTWRNRRRASTYYLHHYDKIYVTCTLRLMSSFINQQSSLLEHVCRCWSPFLCEFSNFLSKMIYMFASQLVLRTVYRCVSNIHNTPACWS